MIGSIITIGNFDGVHLGHQYVLSCLKKESIKRELEPLVITFDPIPKVYFGNQKKQIPDPLCVSSIGRNCNGD